MPVPRTPGGDLGSAYTRGVSVVHEGGRAPGDVRERFLSGFRVGTGYAMAAFVVALSFGVLAREAGLSAVQAVVMSAIVFAGSAQFAVVSILATGGSAVAALAAAGLMNSRFLAMGIALAPSLPGGPVARGLQGQTVVDASWALANRGDGTFDRWVLFGSTLPQYATWVLGTASGAVLGDVVGDLERLGLDAVFPAFFAVLVVSELRTRRGALAAVTGAAIALALTPVAPPGLPVLAATAAALIGLVGVPRR